jgi:hypothetical protein
MAPEYGAAGDGVTDDTAAIQAALDDGAAGATVLFPSGRYRITEPLAVAKQQRLLGVHQTRYDPTEDPTSPCAIVCDPAAWSGGEAITVPPTAFGAHLDNIALIGPGVSFAGTVHGVDTGPHAARIGEISLHLSGCTVSGFSGAAVHGHLWVLRITDDCNLSANGWGVLVDGDNAILDARIDGCDMAYNRYGGITIDSTRQSGAVDFTNLRVERSGQTYGDPASPAAFASHAIQIRNASFVRLSHVSTDANTGSGLDITPGVGQSVYNVSVRSSAFKRDGGGDQSYTVAGGYDVVDNGMAGVNIVGADFVTFDSEVGYGAADDGGGGPISPQYGLHVEDTLGQYIGPGRIEVLPFANSIRFAGTNNNTTMDNTPLGLRTVPAIADETFMPTVARTGMVVFRVDLGALMVRRFSGDWQILLGHDGTNPPRFPPIVDLYGAAGQDQAVRFLQDDQLRALIAADDITGDLRVDVHDLTTEAYLGTPLVIRNASRLVETAQQSITPDGTGRVLCYFNAPTGQTGSMVEYRVNSALVGGVTAGGRAYGPDATASDQYVPLGQLQSVVAASTDFADFQSRIAAL